MFNYFLLVVNILIFNLTTSLKENENENYLTNLRFY